MPLSKAKMRERKRQERVKPMSNLNPQEDVKPKDLEDLVEEIKQKGHNIRKGLPIGHGLPLGKDRQSKGFSK